MFPCWKLSNVSSKWYCHFRCVWPDLPKLRKTKSLLFLRNIVRKKWMTKLTFCMQVSMKTYYKSILWFWWKWSSISKVPKIASLQCLKKKVRAEVDFLQADKHQLAYKLISTLWAPNLAMMKHSQISQSNNFANLCNISKKLGMEFIFCMQINTKVFKNWYYRFWWKQQIKRLAIFL